MIHRVEFIGGPIDGMRKDYDIDPSIAFIETVTWGHVIQHHTYMIIRPEIAKFSFTEPMFTEPIDCKATHVSSRSDE